MGGIVVGVFAKPIAGSCLDRIGLSCVMRGTINLAGAPVRTPTTSVGGTVPFPNHNVSRVLTVEEQVSAPTAPFAVPARGF